MALSSVFRILDLIVLALFFLPIPLIVMLQGGWFYYWDYLSSRLLESASVEVYDFVVVGGGSAGAVVANRLSKNGKVLLLEAGGDPPWYTYIPVLALEMLNRSEVDWKYTTVPQKYSSFAMRGKQAIWPRGKVLGGSSALNYMIYVRSHPNDYQVWANITGDSDWSYDKLLPYFKKSLVYKGEHGGNIEHYSDGAYGYLHVESRAKPQPIYNTLMQAVKELGYGEVDLNGPQRSGFGSIESTLKRGSRCSSYTAFLEPILHRKNLRIVRYAQVTKIKLNKRGNTAEGVWYTRHGRKYFARVKKEVIISAGAIDSPKLLMLSGIGPKQHLKEMGIPTKVDLPVGKFMKDHIGMFLVPILLDGDAKISTLPEKDFGLNTLAEYFLNGTGHLTYPSLLYAQGFVMSSVAKKRDKDFKDWPDIQLYFSYGGNYENLAKDASRVTGAKLEDYEKYMKNHSGKDGMSVGVVLVRPKSVGNLRLKSKDPKEYPEIDPNYLEHPDDIKAFVEGIKWAMDLVEQTTSFKKVNARMPNDVKWPGCKEFQFRSDKYWECYARHVSFSIYHPVGTCRMGKKVGDTRAVVDSQLRVLKTKNLRVIDASVMPEIVNGNTNAPTIMIGEKGVDMIRKFWSEQYLVCDRWLESIFWRKNASQQYCFYSQLT